MRRTSGCAATTSTRQLSLWSRRAVQRAPASHRSAFPHNEGPFGIASSRPFEKLRLLRRRRLLSIRELCERSGVSKTTISGLERGEHGAQPRTVRSLAEALGVEGWELLHEEEQD